MNHPIKRPTYEEQIKDLFTPADIGCMSAAVDLASYEGVRSNAAKISEWIGSGRMPPPDENRKWSPEKLQTFRNWASNTGYAQNAFVRIQPSDRPRLRRSVHELNDSEIELLKSAFQGIMDRDSELANPQSFFNLAGIHWLPGPRTDCRHHDDAYNPWHRAYLMAFEDGLRSVEGCEDVTLPYWDILGEKLPDWVYDKPFFPYEFPHELESFRGEIYAAGETIHRHDADGIFNRVEGNKPNIEVKIGEAMAADRWSGFNGWSATSGHEGIIRAHDNGHGACGDTIANQDVAAFDPLFWFFHCNWDRLWWKWQTDKNTQSLMAFVAVVEGDTHWLSEVPETLLAPFDVNAAEMIDLSTWNIDYEHPPEESFDFDMLVAAARGHAEAVETFSIPTKERYSIRVKNINRLDIPGSFSVVLYAGERALDSTRIFQPSAPRECDNCNRHGVFSTDFIVDRDAVTEGEQIRVAIELELRGGETQTIPLSQAGNPTVNVRLLLNSNAGGED